jgi:hypothetical protein
MENSHYRFIRVDREGDVFRARLRQSRLEEGEIQQVGEELGLLVTRDGCRKLALSLGPEPPDCMYSVFLAKLVGVRNLLARHAGRMVLCEVAPLTYSVFEACLLHREFTFLPDFAAAVAHFVTAG